MSSKKKLNRSQVKRLVGIVLFGLIIIAAIASILHSGPFASEVYPSYIVTGTLTHDEGSVQSNPVIISVVVPTPIPTPIPTPTPTPTPTPSVEPTPSPASPAADLSISKSHTDNFTVGQNGTYIITVLNNGPATAANATITDTLPAGLTYVLATGSNWNCTNASQVVTCVTSTPLEKGTSSALTMTVAVTGSAASSVVNTVSVTSTTPDPDTSNNTAKDTATVTNPSSDLSIKKSHSGNFTVTQQGTYSVTVTNNGPTTTVGDITVTDTLPNGLTFVSVIGAGWTCTNSGQNITCRRGNTLIVNATSDITVTVLPTISGTVTNSVTVSNAKDTNPANNTASDQTIVNPLPASPVAATAVTPTPAPTIPQGPPKTGKQSWWKWLFGR